MHRRQLMTGFTGLAAASVLSGRAQANAGARSLSLVNLHTGEALQATYWEAGAYVPDALAALAHILRDHRNGEARAISPALFDLVNTLRLRTGSRATVQVISGYRSPGTNAALHARSDGVASRSLHMLGEAMDLRIADVDLTRLRDAAWSMQQGGVGFYPRSQFLHVDVGRLRRWQGV
jgi:uncharacterized protein YcbK (DUF882 family)